MDPTASWSPVYNTVLMDPATREREGSVRPLLLEALLDGLRGDAPSRPSWLIGGSGTGKTATLCQLEHRVRDDESLRERWLVLAPSTALLGLLDPAELWETLLAALARELVRAGELREAAAVQAVVAALPGGDAARRGDAALWSLGAWAEGHRGLVLCIDDAHLLASAVVKALGDVASHTRLCLVASSQGEPPASVATVLDDAGLRYHRLGPLSLPSARRLVRQLAAAHATPELARVLSEHPARFRAVHALAADTPRSLALLTHVLAAAPDAPGHQLVERVLDLRSPSFSARLEGLPPQARRVVLALARAWEPSTAASVARRCSMHVNKASAQLARLANAGVVEKVRLHAVQRTGFQLADRGLALWCLLRSGPEGRLALARLARFIERLHSPQPKPAPTAPAPGGGGSLSMFRSRSWRRSADRAGLLGVDPVAGGNPRRAPELTAARLADAGSLPLTSLQQLEGALPGATDSAEPPSWHSARVALRDLVEAGQAAEAYALMARTEAGEHWRPVLEALRAVIGGTPDVLLDVPPEQRAPALQVLELIQPSGG